MRGIEEESGFRFLRRIGAGGASRVYEARDDRLQRTIAVKEFLHPLEDSQSRAAFEQECRIAARVGEHPNIATVYAAGVADGLPWLAMPLFKDGSLAQRMRSGRLSLEQSLRIAITVAEALDWAHRQNPPVLHRDVKPGNILLDGHGMPTLSDFGVACSFDGRCSTTVAAFSPDYAAPEVLGQGRYSLASEIWSLTAVIFEMLTGTAPFKIQSGEGIGSLVDRMHRGNEQPALPFELPAPLRALISSGLSLNPNSRPSDMAEVAMRLRAVERELGLDATAKAPVPARTNSEAEVETHLQRLAIGLFDAPTRGHDPQPLGSAPLGFHDQPTRSAVETQPRRYGTEWHEMSRTLISVGVAVAVTCVILVFTLTDAGTAVASHLARKNGPTPIATKAQTDGDTKSESLTSVIQPSPTVPGANPKFATPDASARTGGSPITVSNGTSAVLGGSSQVSSRPKTSARKPPKAPPPRRITADTPSFPPGSTAAAPNSGALVTPTGMTPDAGGPSADQVCDAAYRAGHPNDDASAAEAAKNPVRVAWLPGQTEMYSSVGDDAYMTREYQAPNAAWNWTCGPPGEGTFITWSQFTWVCQNEHPEARLAKAYVVNQDDAYTWKCATQI